MKAFEHAKRVVSLQKTTKSPAESASPAQSGGSSIWNIVGHATQAIERARRQLVGGSRWSRLGNVLDALF